MQYSEKEYQKCLERLEKLKTDLKEVSTQKADAANNDPGNTWHDNFTFEQLELQENFVFNQIASLTKDMENSNIIKVGNVNKDCVDIYDKVHLVFTYDDGFQEEETLTLADGEKNSISLSSSLGQALYGSIYGNIVEYKSNGKVVKVEIKKIDY